MAPPSPYMRAPCLSTSKIARVAAKRMIAASRNNLKFFIYLSFFQCFCQYAAENFSSVAAVLYLVGVVSDLKQQVFCRKILIVFVAPLQDFAGKSVVKAMFD